MKTKSDIYFTTVLWGLSLRCKEKQKKYTNLMGKYHSQINLDNNFNYDKNHKNRGSLG